MEYNGIAQGLDGASMGTLMGADINIRTTVMPISTSNMEF